MMHFPIWLILIGPKGVVRPCQCKISTITPTHRKYAVLPAWYVHSNSGDDLHNPMIIYMIYEVTFLFGSLASANA